MNPTAYDLADRLIQLAPWDWMEETQLIALEEPETGRRDHISIMGAIGTHQSLAVYLGPEARRRFNLIQAERGFPQEDILTLIIDTPQLQCSFTGRGDLFKTELAAIKQAGRKYRGENWPSFRSFRPGHCPAIASEREIRWLCTAITQVLEIAPTLNFGGGIQRFENGRSEILTRRLLNGEWRTDWTEDDPSLFVFPQPAPNASKVEKVRGQANALPIEVLFQQLPNPIGKSRENSVFPYLVLAVEPRSHLVLGCKLFSVEKQSHDDLISSVPDELLRICNDSSIRPSAIHVASPATHALLAPTAAALGIRCDLKNRLPALEDAYGSMMGYMGGLP
jgi:hypothetical protein